MPKQSLFALPKGLAGSGKKMSSYGRFGDTDDGGSDIMTETMNSKDNHCGIETVIIEDSESSSVSDTKTTGTNRGGMASHKQANKLVSDDEAYCKAGLSTSVDEEDRFTHVSVFNGVDQQFRPKTDVNETVKPRKKNHDSDQHSWNDTNEYVTFDADTREFHVMWEKASSSHLKSASSSSISSFSSSKNTDEEKDTNDDNEQHRIATPPQDLHRACTNARSTLFMLHALIEKHPSLTSMPSSDVRGLFPLQIIANNSSLLLFHRKECAVAFSPPSLCGEEGIEKTKGKSTKLTLTSFIIKVVKAFPEGVLVRDENQSIPFIPALIKWIDKYSQRIPNIYKRQVSKKKKVNDSSEESVNVTPLMEWSFHMLSRVIENVDDDIALQVVREVATLSPVLLKIISCIEDDIDRHRIFSYPILRQSIIASANQSCDDAGRLPLHVIAEKSQTLSQNVQDVESLVRELVEAHPESAIKSYRGGSIPFLSEIHDWIESTLSGRRPEEIFPLNVTVPPGVDLSFQMLSSILDQLEHESCPREDCTQSRRKKITPFSSTLSEEVASIPSFIKTLIFIEDVSSRNRIFSYTIVRRAVLCKESIDNNSLTFMLKSENSKVAQKAIGYLEMLSSISSEDFSDRAEGNEMEQNNEEYFRQKYKTMLRAIGKLEGFLSCLLCLEKKAEIDCVATKVVSTILDEMIQTPYVLLLIFLDILFLVLMLTGLRMHVYTLHTEKEAIGHGYFMSVTGVLYFMIRDLCVVFYTYSVFSWRDFASHLLEFWNAVDIVSTFVTFAGLTSSMSQTNDVDGIKSSSFVCLAFGTGLLWVRILGFLRRMIVQIASTIASFNTILKDLLWILVIICFIVIAFAQVMFTMSASSERCSKDENIAICSPVEYYLQSYAFLVGDIYFDRQEMFSTPAAVFSFILFSFLVVLVLLNFLIAIVSDSYEKSLVQFKFARRQFVIQRLEFISQAVALERVLRLRHKLNKGLSCGNIFSLSVLFLSLVLINLIIIFLWTGDSRQLLAGMFGVNIGLVVVYLILVTVACGSNTSGNITWRVMNNQFVRHCCEWLSIPIQIADKKDDLGLAASNSDFMRKWNGRVNHLKDEINSIVSESQSCVQHDLQVHQNLVLGRMKEEIRASEERTRVIIKEELLKIIAVI